MRGRFVAVVATLLAVSTGCSMYRGLGQDNLSFNTHLSPDEVLRIAEGQLTRAGYVATRQNPNTVTTAAREIRSDTLLNSRGTRMSYWIMRIDAGAAPLTSGTDVRIVGYAFPASQPAADSSIISRTMTITAANPKLWNEIQGVAEKLKDLTR